MSSLYADITPPQKQYIDRSFPGSEADYRRLLEESRTLYIGNVSFSTSEEQLYAVAAAAGDVARVIMGLNARTFEPAGFAFIEFFDRQSALVAELFLNKCRLAGRVVKAEFSTPFTPDRQFGRGASGGQVRDDMRSEFDQGRGGFGGGAQRDGRLGGFSYTEFSGSAAPAGSEARAAQSAAAAAATAALVPAPVVQQTAEAAAGGKRKAEEDDATAAAASKARR